MDSEIDWDRENKQYLLISDEKQLALGEVFMILLMIYNSRALKFSECKEIVNKLIDRLSFLAKRMNVLR
jgi:hypothetical protein